MISSNDAEKMPYLDYKVEVWTRLTDFWQQYELGSPDYVDERLLVCRRYLRYWLGVRKAKVRK